MKLHELTRIVVYKKARVGRGKGSGRGKTSGRGMNGQKARFTSPAGFEGGQMRLFKRLTQLRGRGFKSIQDPAGIVNLGQLNEFYNDGEVVSLTTLIEKGLINKRARVAKILSRGKLSKKVTFADDVVFSKKATQKLKKA